KTDIESAHPLELGASNASAIAFAPVQEAREAGIDAIEAWICRTPAAAYDPDLERARRELVLGAARARARGIALDRARELAGTDGKRWVAWQLYGASAPAAAIDTALSPVLQPLVDGVRDVARPDVDAASGRFELFMPPQHCAAATFRAATPFATR